VEPPHDRTAVRKDLHPDVGEFVWTQGNNYFGWRSLLGREPASLELARQGEVHLAQDGVFTPIHVRGPSADPGADGGEPAASLPLVPSRQVTRRHLVHSAGRTDGTTLTFPMN
jgi:hypothetical protein